MSFIYYKRSKKEKITILKIFPEGRSIQSYFCTPCEILAHLANFGTPCKFNDFALRNGLFPSFLLLVALPTPFQIWQGVLKCSKTRILHVIDLQLALPQLAQNSPSILACFGDQKVTKNTQTYHNLVSNIPQVLNMLIEIKRFNYYSKVINTIKFKLIKMHFLSSNQSQKHKY